VSASEAIARLRELRAKATAHRFTMMDEEVALHDALPALLECAEALEKIAKLPRYTDGDNEAQDIARAALQALAEGGGK
jgi:hypothetical protein